MSYELQVYALSPSRPSVVELLAQAGASGLGVELTDAGQADPGARDWTRLELRPAAGDSGAVSVEVSSELARMVAALRTDREAGEPVPAEVLDAEVLYVLELPGGEREDDGDLAGSSGDEAATFVVAAWALATLTEGIVFDPQEELFADAESFWALVMGEDEEGSAPEDEGSDRVMAADREGAP